MRSSKKNSSVWQYLVTFAVGAVIANLDSPSSYLPSLKETTSYWLNQAKGEYYWNSTSNLTWSATATFTQLAVSPLGDLYGLQAYNDSKTVV